MPLEIWLTSWLETAQMAVWDQHVNWAGTSQSASSHRLVQRVWQTIHRYWSAKRQMAFMFIAMWTRFSFIIDKWSSSCSGKILESFIRLYWDLFFLGYTCYHWATFLRYKTYNCSSSWFYRALCPSETYCNLK